MCVALIPMVLAFQNCGKGFSAADLKKTSSSQCKAQMKSEALKQKWTNSDFRCDDFASYSCERRVFSPDVQDMSHNLTECLPGDTICVDVEVRQFNTSVARGPASNSADFAPGGSYNHEEVNCHHRWLYNGIALFEGSSSTMEESLSAAMSACEKALENP